VQESKWFPARQKVQAGDAEQAADQNNYMADICSLMSMLMAATQRA
jgi:hypothetical protein